MGFNDFFSQVNCLNRNRKKMRHEGLLFYEEHSALLLKKAHSVPCSKTLSYKEVLNFLGFSSITLQNFKN